MISGAPAGHRRRGQLTLRGLRFAHPAQVVVAGFAVAVAVGTALLMLPVARSGPDGAPFLEALFTATSAVCVTGHIVVDTPATGRGSARQ